MAKQEQIVTIKVETGQAKGALGGLGKDLDNVDKKGKKTSKGMGAAFKGIKGAVLGAIPALRAFTAALVSTGVGALVVAVGALTSVFVKAAGKGAEFQKALSGLKAVAGATDEEVAMLSDQAKQLGSTTAFTASQVVALQTEMAKLGFSVGDIANSTPAVLDLAASLDVDLASAAEFTGSVVRSFGLDTAETKRVVDVMAQSAVSSAQNFGTLTESFKLAAPTAKALGVTVEETAAYLGVLANNGLKGSIAGTGLSKTFIQLNKQGLSLDEAMAKVAGSSNKLNTAVELVGVVGAKSLLTLAENQPAIEELNEKMETAGDTVEVSGEKFEGAAAAIAETRLDNLAGDTTKLASAWEGFLLGLEDGTGPINKIQRFLVQGLTAAITGLSTAINFVGFYFKEMGIAMKSIASGTSDVVGGAFSILGAKIKEFANKALVQIGRIPILGRAIDTAAAKRRIKEAAKSLDEAEARIRKGRDTFQQQALRDATFFARFAEEQKGAAQRVEMKKQQKETEALQAQMDEEAKKKEEERAKQREKDLEKIADIEKKYIKKSEDLTDTTNLLKVQRQRERGLAEIEALVLTEEEKRKAIDALNAFYDDKEAEAAAKDAEKETAAAQKKQNEKIKNLELEREFDAMSFEEQRQVLAERRQALLDDEILTETQKQELLGQFAEAEAQMDAKKVASKQAMLQAVANVAGAETKVGQALLIAKNILTMKEMIMDLKKITFKGKSAVAEAGVNAAQNVSESSKIGFPQNIITIAAAIGQGISIIQQVKKAVGKTKAAGAGSATAPTVAATGGRGATEQQSPAFNIVGASQQSQVANAIAGANQRPVKAYVTSNDVSTAQALDRNIVEGASI
jgi:hypothetical protein|tara:strand:- start:15242 stop:17809 length:2568 start_codon:yes stop_codon:yes gene_type:complete